jgi:hypothetical protein
MVLCWAVATHSKHVLHASTQLVKLPKTKQIQLLFRATSADFWIQPNREASRVGFGFGSRPCKGDSGKSEWQNILTLDYRSRGFCDHFHYKQNRAFFGIVKISLVQKSWSFVSTPFVHAACVLVDCRASSPKNGHLFRITF